MADLLVEGLDVKIGGRPIVRGIDLTVPAGVVTALVGPNGAGKSTLVLALSGLLRASGSVRLGGEEVLGKRPDVIRRAGLVAVPEGHRVLTRLTVEENIDAALGSTPPTTVAEAREKAYTTFPELEPLANQGAGSLSGGQQQMLAFAQALVAGPKILVIDEMSLGLAPVIVQRLRKVVAATAASGIGVLLIEQYISVALDLAEHACVMHKGSISYDGPAQVLLDHPDTLHTAYFGETSS